ncbi:MAG: hypothetical protein O7B81_01715 [Gammaproteobacteria bacterium]|nr:hypothetical protein [Gammaproteobacteria bacterium]
MQAALRQRPGNAEAVSVCAGPGGVPVAARAGPYFDELAQETVWPLHDDRRSLARSSTLPAATGSERSAPASRVMV